MSLQPAQPRLRSPRRRQRPTARRPSTSQSTKKKSSNQAGRPRSFGAALFLIPPSTKKGPPQLFLGNLYRLWRPPDTEEVNRATLTPFRMNTYEKQAVRGGALLLTRHPMKRVCPACPELLGERPSGGVRRFRPGRKGPLFTRRHKPREPRLLVHRHGLRGARRIANSVYQRHQARAVLVRYCDEFQPQSAAGNHMLHDCLDPDLSFRNKKIKLDSRARAPRTGCREEQPPHAQVADARNIFQSIASPAGPHVVMCFDSRNLSSGIERSYTRGCHSSPRACGIERVVKTTTHGSQAHGRP